MTPPPPETSQDLVARILAAASGCFLAVFLAVFLAALLPIRLSDATWQLEVSASLVNNGGFVLISLMLLRLASEREPANGRWQARCTTYRQLAISAILGFLLLVPLQAFTTWKLLAASQAASSEQQQVTQRFGALREAIRTAPTLRDLQGRVGNSPFQP